jgi:hypothetical protein
MGKKELLDIVRASDVEPKKPSWLWRRRFLREEINVIAGHPGVGKSFITIEMAARVTKGREWPDGIGKAPEGNVVIMAAEDDYNYVIVPRLKAVNADLERVFFVKGKREEANTTMVKLDTDYELLEATLRDKEAAMLIVDPALSYVSGKVRVNEEANIRKTLMYPLARVASRTGASIVLVTHLNKKPDLDRIQRAGGAMAIVGFPRASKFVERISKESDPVKRLRMSTLKMSLAKEPAPLEFEIVDVCPDDPDDDTGMLKWNQDQPVTLTPTLEIDRARVFLFGLLPAFGPDVAGVPQTDVIDLGQAQALSERTIDDASRDLDGKGLKVVKKPSGKAKPWRWWLPPGVGK